MFWFDDPPKLHSPSSSQVILPNFTAKDRSPTGEKWAKRHSEPTHPPDIPTQIYASLPSLQIPVPGQSPVQRKKHVMQI